MKEFYIKTQVPYDCPDDLKQLLIDEMKEHLPEGAKFRGSLGLGMFGTEVVAIIYTMGEPDG